MRESSLNVYRCPACRGPLALARRDGTGEEVTTGVLSCGCGISFPVENGVPALVHPPSQDYLRENAETYDELISFEARLLEDDERKVRTLAADLPRTSRTSFRGSRAAASSSRSTSLPR